MRVSSLSLRSIALVGVALALVAGVAVAQIGPIEFTEPEFPPDAPVQNLTITTLDGVQLPAPLSFDFPNADATITGGPGTQLYVDPPGIEGPSGLALVIDFGAPVDSAEFGFAVSCPPVVQNALAVELFDSSGTSVGMESYDGVDTGFASAENLVSISGVVFQRLEATWSDCGAPGDGLWGQTEGNGGSRFFLDTMTYAPTTGVPTMSSAALVALTVVLAVVALWFLRRKTAVA